MLILLLGQNRNCRVFSPVHIILASYAIIMNLAVKEIEESPPGRTCFPCTYFMAEVCQRKLSIYVASFHLYFVTILSPCGCVYSPDWDWDDRFNCGSLVCEPVLTWMSQHDANEC